EPSVMPVGVAGDVVEWMRPWAHQAHVPQEHVPELRQLVDAPATQRLAELRDPRVVGQLERRTALDLVTGPERVALRVGAAAHRPELGDRERLAITARARLAEEDRAPVRDEDQQRYDGQDGRQDDE